MFLGYSNSIGEVLKNIRRQYNEKSKVGRWVSVKCIGGGQNTKKG